MKVSYDWLTEYTGKTALGPEEIEALLTFHAFEIEGVESVGSDTVIDVDVLPNRSSDCLSHRGIARELATLTKTPLAHDPLATPPKLIPTEAIAITIEDKATCPRFTASLLEGVTVKESPQWLKDRLATIGQRSINNIVDATNYVMYALGQPLHAYDADLFPQHKGAWRFEIRTAKAHETVNLLPESGQTERVVELDGNETLVVDAGSNTPIGLAGVKGGRFAGVHEGTTRVIIEAANFHPTRTRLTARRHGIITDAGKRFENEPSRELPLYAQAEIIALILDIAGGTYAGTADTYLEPVVPPRVKLSVAHANSLLGLALSLDEMAEILSRVGCELSHSDDTITTTGPWERTDLQIAEDFIEEIGRVYGYGHIAASAPTPVPLTEYNKRHYYSEKVRQLLIELGFSEVITSSFRKKDIVALQNALASDKGCLRSQLSAYLSEVLDKNAPHADLLGNDDTRVFEIGTVFTKGGDLGVTEHVSLCLGVRLRPSGYSGKEDKLLMDVCAEIEALLGVAIEWEMENGVAEVPFTALLQTLPDVHEYDSVPPAPAVTYQPFSVYPAVSRDIAMWTSDDTMPAEVESVLNTHAGPLRVQTRLFDEFTKDGKTSFAFRLVFQSNEKTLTDTEVNTIMDGVYQAVAGQGWEVR